jgi:hypothetical protein
MTIHQFVIQLAVTKFWCFDFGCWISGLLDPLFEGSVELCTSTTQQLTGFSTLPKDTFLREYISTNLQTESKMLTVKNNVHKDWKEESHNW